MGYSFEQRECLVSFTGLDMKFPVLPVTVDKSLVESHEKHSNAMNSMIKPNMLMFIFKHIIINIIREHLSSVNDQALSALHHTLIQRAVYLGRAYFRAAC
jgi:hypothetical protein